MLHETNETHKKQDTVTARGCAEIATNKPIKTMFSCLQKNAKTLHDRCSRPGVLGKRVYRTSKKVIFTNSGNTHSYSGNAPLTFIYFVNDQLSVKSKYFLKIWNTETAFSDGFIFSYNET